MRKTNRRDRSRGAKGPEKRSSLLTIVTALGVLIVGMFLAGSAIQAQARRSAERDVLEAARRLYDAMEAYTVAMGGYPSNGDPLEVTFDKQTLEPLVREGTLSSTKIITRNLASEQVAVYCSPDLPTRNSDFWAVLVSRNNAQVKALVADTDEYPGREGERLRGVYLLRSGEWVPKGL